MTPDAGQDGSAGRRAVLALVALLGGGAPWPAHAHIQSPRVRRARRHAAAGARKGTHKVRPDALALLARALAAQGSGGNVSLRVLLAAARKGHVRAAIVWSMAHGHFALARALALRSSRPLPPWITLELALHDEDIGAIARLAAHPRALSDEGAARAYFFLGDYVRAQSVALRAVEDNPLDRADRRFFLRTIDFDASHVTVGTQWLSFGHYVYGDEDARGRVYMSPDAGILIRERALWQRAGAGSLLSGIPAGQQMAEAGVFVHGPHWQAQTAWGTRHAWRHVVTGIVSARWWSGALHVRGHLGLHRFSRQSPALVVAGMKNDAFVQAAYHGRGWAGHVYAGWTAYQGQDGVTIGTDRYAGVGVYRPGHFGFLAWQIGPFADYHAITRSATLTGVLAQSLGPLARTPGSVLAASRADYGLSAFLGSTHAALAAGWSPYVAASLYESTRFGLQYEIAAGVRTPVRGADQFRLTFSQGQGRNVLAQTERTVEASYSVYFS